MTIEFDVKAKIYCMNHAGDSISSQFFVYIVAAKIIRPPNKKILFVLFFQDERRYRSEVFIML